MEIGKCLFSNKGQLLKSVPSDLAVSFGGEGIPAPVLPSGGWHLFIVFVESLWANGMGHSPKGGVGIYPIHNLFYLCPAMHDP